jgi:hypothetical protein
MWVAWLESTHGCDGSSLGSKPAMSDMAKEVALQHNQACQNNLKIIIFFLFTASA